MPKGKAMPPADNRSPQCPSAYGHISPDLPPLPHPWAPVAFRASLIQDNHLGSIGKDPISKQGHSPRFQLDTSPGSCARTPSMDP